MLLDLLYHHTVNTWDTSQGIARNKPTLLKFQPIQDIEARVPECRSASSFGYTPPLCESSCAFTPTPLHLSYGTALVASGNAFASFTTDTSYTRWAASTPESAGYCTFAGVGSAVSFGSSPPVGGADAVFAPVVENTTSYGEFLPRGIKNPTDEELAALVVNHLLTRKQNSYRLVV